MHQKCLQQKYLVFLGINNSNLVYIVTIVNRRGIDRYIIDLIILIEVAFLILSYYVPFDSLKKLLFSLFVLNFSLWIYGFKDKTNLKYKNILIIISFITISISTIFYGAFYRGSLVYAIIFLTSLMLLQYLFNHGLDSTNLKSLIYSNIALVIVHLINASKITSFTEVSHALVLVYDNSNMTGIVLMASLLILIIGVFYFKNKYFKVFLVILTLLISNLLLQTQNRGSILAMIIFVILLLYHRKGKDISNLTRFLLISFPILSVLFYSSLLLIFPVSTEILGKPLFSGREIEWQRILNQIYNSPMAIAKLPTGGLNMSLAGITEFGFLSYFFYTLLIFNIKPVFKNEKNLTYQKVAYLAFLCIFIQQSFESTLLLGSWGIYIFNYLLLGISFSGDSSNGILLTQFQRKQ